MKRDDLSPHSDPALLAAVAGKAADAVRLLRAAARDFAPVVFASSLGAGGTAHQVSPPARAGLGAGGQKVGAGRTAPNDPAVAA